MVSSDGDVAVHPPSFTVRLQPALIQLPPTRRTGTLISRMSATPPTAYLLSGGSGTPGGVRTLAKKRTPGEQDRATI
jgi:hypothetical protein